MNAHIHQIMRGLLTVFLLLSCCLAFSACECPTEEYIISNSFPAPVSAKQTPSEPPKASCDYILNTNTKKFHRPDCYSVDLILEENKICFIGAREDVITQGYAPCGHYHP